MSPKQFVNKEGEKCCTLCKKWKLLKDFSSDPRTSTKTSGRCRTCSYKLNNERYKNNPEFRAKVNKSNKNNALINRYGITLGDRDYLIKEQENKCAICKVEFDSLSKSFRPSVDHNHLTGKVRDLLCRTCNTGLGMFKENQDFLLEAIIYLRKHSG